MDIVASEKDIRKVLHCYPIMASIENKPFVIPRKKNIFSCVVPDLRFFTKEELEKVLLELDNF